MRKIFAVILVLSMLFAFAGCKAGTTTEGDVVVFENPDNAYVSMTNAAENGEYEKAVQYYKSGAADADDSDVINWYFYSLAMKEYEEYKCIGYPLDMLMNNIGDGFDKADAIISELQGLVRNYNGVYECAGVYLYIADGKIAVSDGEQLSGTVFCTDEFAYKDNVYYWAERGQDDSHKFLYEIEATEKGIRLTATEDNENDIYSGEYSPIPAEFPQLIY